MAENIYIADTNGLVQAPYGPVSLKSPNARDGAKLYRYWGREPDGADRLYEMTLSEQAIQKAEWAQPPPPVPHVIDKTMATDPAYKTLVQEMASQFGLTEAQMVAALKARVS